MIRTVKALGLALFAVVALSVVGAATVQAEGSHLTGTKGVTIIGGQQTEHVITIQGSSSKCKDASFTREIVAENHRNRKSARPTETARNSASSTRP